MTGTKLALDIRFKQPELKPGLSYGLKVNFVT